MNPIIKIEHLAAGYGRARKYSTTSTSPSIKTTIWVLSDLMVAERQPSCVLFSDLMNPAEGSISYYKDGKPVKLKPPWDICHNTTTSTSSFPSPCIRSGALRTQQVEESLCPFQQGASPARSRHLGPYAAVRLERPSHRSLERRTTSACSLGTRHRVKTRCRDSRRAQDATSTVDSRNRCTRCWSKSTRNAPSSS